MAEHFLIRTETNAERQAARYLSAQAFHIYLPEILTVRQSDGHVEASKRPFLPTLLFVEDAGQGVESIENSRGVSKVIRSENEPLRVAQSIIDRIRAHEQDGCIRLVETAPLLRSLRKTISDGFDDLFQPMRGATRSLIFINLVMTPKPVLEARADIGQVVFA